MSVSPRNPAKSVNLRVMAMMSKAIVPSSSLTDLSTPLEYRKQG
jgi:hypothetical protein